MATKRVALVGNPNCGKTTLLNELTGSRRRVGNFAGVTVSAQSEQLTIGDATFELVDLPGVYTLTHTEGLGVDESITHHYLFQQAPDIVINVIDTRFLTRGLYITLQMISRGLPIIVALRQEGCGPKLNLSTLAKALGVPVVPANAQDICNAISSGAKSSQLSLPYPEHLIKGATKVLAEMETCQHNRANMLRLGDAIRLLEGDALAINAMPTEMHAVVRQVEQEVLAAGEFEADILIAQARYSFIEQVVDSATSAVAVANQSKLDRFFLHPVLGLPIFFGMMYLMFWFAINVGGVLQSVVEHLATLIFVDAPTVALSGLPDIVTRVLVEGAGTGLVTTLSFAPVIGAMFIALGFLEESGYMARGAFVIDRFMQFIGLPGKSFVPLVIGFGCNVPAILGARTLERQQDRIITILMSPFMSCGARLAIFTVFVAAFFPKGGHNVVFALYIIGILMAVLTGMVLKRAFIKSGDTVLVMEMPPYRLPRFGTLWSHAKHRLNRFLQKAGKIIVPLCMVLSLLNTPFANSQNTPLAAMGRVLTPVFAPMGIEQDNWPATVGLLSGLIAKEVVVGTLNTLYAPEVQAEAPDLLLKLQDTTHVLADGLHDLVDSITNPLAAKATSAQLSSDAQVALVAHFSSASSAFAYLLFVLLYFPCVSVIATMNKEVKMRWTMFAVVWTTALAYGAAVLFYQYANLARTSWQAGAWTIAIFTILYFITTKLPRVRSVIPTKIVTST